MKKSHIVYALTLGDICERADALGNKITVDEADAVVDRIDWDLIYQSINDSVDEAIEQIISKRKAVKS